MTAFGNTSSTSATSVAPGFAWCMPITLTSSAIVTAYNLNMNETSSFYSLQMGIYSDNGGAPWTLLASTGTQATVNGWGTLWLTNPVNLSGNGAVYWIVSLVTGGVGMTANSSYVPSGSLLGTGTYSILPASLTGANNNGSYTNQPSVYLNGCLIGGPPTSTWTPTVTSTPTATITFTPTVTLTAQPTPACSPFTTMGNILGTFPAGYQVQYVFAIPITLLSSDESAYSMAVDCIGVTSPIRLGIYDDNGGAPNNLLAETDYSASMSVGSYTTLPLLNPVFLNGGGKVYWLAYFYSYGTYGNPENMYEQGIAGVKSSGIYGDLPSSLAGQTTSYPVIASIYMNVCP